MYKINLPAYAIVELLMRLADLNNKIGDYKGHTSKSGYALVKTTNGSIMLPNQLVMLQFEAPETITTDMLAQAAVQFKPARIKKPL